VENKFVVLRICDEKGINTGALVMHAADVRSLFSGTGALPYEIVGPDDQQQFEQAVATIKKVKFG
jgi:hypothetical protein